VAGDVGAAAVSAHAAFRRQPVPQQYAQALKAITIPAPTRGIVQHENDAFMGPGSCVISDNWMPTMKGVKLRGGCTRWCVLPDAVPVVSGFEYVSGNTQRMFAGQATKLFDVTATVPTLIKSGQTSGNYCASQLANLSGYWMLVCNETGDSVLRFDGTAWTTLTTELTNGPVPGTSKNLSYVCKYRNRFYFIETKSMNLWYLPIDSHQGLLTKIPMSGAASRGGYLLFLANWSIDAGDGIDDKLVAVTSEGEALIFTGNDPASPATWRQEGRYFVGRPMGMNAHEAVGGDLLILTVEGIVPISQSITKSAGELELAMISRAIKRMWREEALAKIALPWTIRRWDEYGGIFITFPGGTPGNRYCLAMNAVTGAFARAVGWDAMCFLRMRADMFFGTQDGIIMQADRTGYDDGKPYVATLVGGWEMFQARSQMVTWHQARAVFTSGAVEPFQPQLDATVDYIVVIPPPPAPGPDPGIADVWDQGKWGPDMGGPPPPVPTAPQRAQYAQWDQPSPARPANRNTMWVSIGKTGFSHAPIVQVTVAQQAKPDVELVCLQATFEQAGINV